MNDVPSGTWFHGSPLELTELRPGSTITPNRELARAFSHKPSLVSIQDDGSIRHNGRRPGYLYVICEEVRPGDVEPVPRSTMDPGQEWRIKRRLKVVLVAHTEVRPEERLSRWESVVLRLRQLFR